MKNRRQKKDTRKVYKLEIMLDVLLLGALLVAAREAHMTRSEYVRQLLLKDHEIDMWLRKQT